MYARIRKLFFNLPIQIKYMANRRNFIQHIGLMAGAFSANSLFNQAHAAEFEHINLQKKIAQPQGISNGRGLLECHSTRLYRKSLLD